MVRAVKGEEITPEAFNEIQKGLDDIVFTWGLPKQGSHEVGIETITAKVMNDWITWLKYYAGRVGASSITNGISGVTAGVTQITASKINQVVDASKLVVSYCNRTECNGYECNKSETQRDECNDSECNYPESDRGQESDRSKENHRDRDW